MSLVAVDGNPLLSPLIEPERVERALTRTESRNPIILSYYCYDLPVKWKCIDQSYLCGIGVFDSERPLHGRTLMSKYHMHVQLKETVPIKE